MQATLHAGSTHLSLPVPATALSTPEEDEQGSHLLRHAPQAELQRKRGDDDCRVKQVPPAMQGMGLFFAESSRHDRCNGCTGCIISAPTWEQQRAAQGMRNAAKQLHIGPARRPHLLCVKYVMPNTSSLATSSAVKMARMPIEVYDRAWCKRAGDGRW